MRLLHILIDACKMEEELRMGKKNEKHGRKIDVDAWLANTHSPKRRATKAKNLIERDAKEDLSGTNPFWDEENRLYFVQKIARVVGRKLL